MSSRNLKDRVLELAKIFQLFNSTNSAYEEIELSWDAVIHIKK